MTFLKGTKLFGNNIIIIINTALLTIAYIVGVGLSKIFSKKDILQTKKQEDTYWEELNLKKQDIKKYYRQF